MHLIMSQQEKRKTKSCWTSIHNKNRTFTTVIYAHSQFLCSLARFDLANLGVRHPVQPHLFCAPLLIFDKTSAQPDFAVANCCHSDERVLLCCFNALPDIFAVMICCVVALCAFSFDILTWSADSLYCVQ